MKTMKRMFTQLLAIMMVCSLFTACNIEDDGDHTMATVTIPVVDDFKNVDRYPLEGEHKLTVAVTHNNPDDAYLFQVMEEAIGVDLTYRTVTKEQSTLMFLDADNLPDMMFGDGNKMYLTQAQINEYGEGGLLINFMDYLDKMPNLSKAIAAHPEMLDGLLTQSGAMYSLPSYVATLTAFNNILYWREDHLKAAGWDTAPTTIDEFVQALRDLQAHFGANDPEYYALTVYQGSHMGYNSQLSRYLFPSFGDIIEADIITDSTGKKIVAGFADEQYKRYLTFVRSLMEEGLMDPDAVGAVGNLMKAFMNEGHTSVNTLMVYMPTSAFPSGNLDIIIPGMLNSQYNTDTKFAERTPTGGWGMMISANTKDLDACLAYMDAFYATEENPLDDAGQIYNLTLFLGKEGVDWDWVEEGKSYKTYPQEGYADIASWGLDAGYSNAPYLGDFYMIPYENDIASFKAVQIEKNLLPDLVKVVRTKSLTLTQDERDIYIDAWTDVQKCVKEYTAAFLAGEKNIEAEWDTYVATLYELGLQDCIDVYQAALDRYNAG